MSEKTLKTRIQNKRGTTAEWATGTAPNFVPKDGEIVAYTDVHRIKIGDGTTKVSALPFVDKVRDVTLGGESMVNANGVVELQPTEMTDGCIPVWNNTEKIFIDSYCHNTADGLQVEGSIGMYSYEYTLDINVQDGSFSYSDDGQNTIKKYALPITKNSGTLALTSDIPSTSNFVTTNIDQTITGHKTFSAGLTADALATFNGSANFNEDLTLACPIVINNNAGADGQVLTSQGTGKSPIWKTFTASAPSNMVTTDTAQTITGTKTFDQIQIALNGIFKDCEAVFETADGGQQSLGIDGSMGSSCSTSFVLPKINQSATFELGTALYNHCVILSGTNCTATFNVLCNKASAFTGVYDIYNTIKSQQTTAAPHRIAASGRVYGTSISAVKVVNYVEFSGSGVIIHYLNLSDATSGTLTGSFVSDSVISCNLTTN